MFENVMSVVVDPVTFTDPMGTTAPLGEAEAEAAAAITGMFTPYAVKSPTRTQVFSARLIRVAKLH